MTAVQAEELIHSGKLPPGTTVEGGLDLSGCTSFTTLPEGLKVGGPLYLYKCTSLITLLEGLKVSGGLDVSGCTSLTTLPKGLKVEGWLKLTGCTSLTTIPEGLKVVGVGVDLYGCTSLQLPHGIPEEVKGEVYADEAFFKANKDHLLQMVNTKWGDQETKDAYMKVLAGEAL